MGVSATPRRGLGFGGGQAITLTLRGLFLVGPGIRLLLGLTRTRLASLLTLPLLLGSGQLGLAEFLGLRLGRSQLLLILLGSRRLGSRLLRVSSGRLLISASGNRGLL